MRAPVWSAQTLPCHVADDAALAVPPFPCEPVVVGIGALVVDLTKILAVGVTLLLFLLARLLERAGQLDEEMREIV